MAVLVCWALIALCIVALGRMIGSQFVIGVGATMVLMMSMVTQVS